MRSCSLEFLWLRTNVCILHICDITCVMWQTKTEQRFWWDYSKWFKSQLHNNKKKSSVEQWKSHIGLLNNPAFEWTSTASLLESKTNIELMSVFVLNLSDTAAWWRHRGQRPSLLYAGFCPSSLAWLPCSGGTEVGDIFHHKCQWMLLTPPKWPFDKPKTNTLPTSTSPDEDECLSVILLWCQTELSLPSISFFNLAPPWF